ncbi:MAG: agmatine deiminase family protein [Bacteriodetes bacterium]|nr:agmatine deiminase family protein [Bacteroidota bacterium]
MRRWFAFICCIVVCNLAVSFSQTSISLTPAQKADALRKAQQTLSTMTAEQRYERILKYQSRKPAQRSSYNVAKKAPTGKGAALQSALTSMPEKFVIPGEFEESQSALLAWPYYAFDKDGNWVDPFTKDFGYLTISQTEYKIVPIATWVIDTVEDVQSQNGEQPLILPPVWAKLADAIQQEVPVWITVYQDADTAVIKEYMAKKGTPLTNYRFINVGGGNAFWMRDFGPVGFYYGDNDDIGLLDMSYYPGRAADDSIPQVLGQKLGYKVYSTQLESEGGNFIADGFGQCITSTAVYYNNADSVAQGYVEKDNQGNWVDYYQLVEPWSNKKTLDTLTYVWGAHTKMTVLPTLQCDGGTGHIDMYTKMFDESTFLTTEYPTQFNKNSFQDYNIAKQNLAKERSMQDIHGRNFRVFTMPVPTSESGRYDSTTCRLFNADPRGFLNGLTINKTFIFPSFSGGGTGNDAGTQAALELYKKYLPGYKLVPFDSRMLTPMAGAVHCITMQIPAENPIRFKHAAIRGNVNQLALYPVSATITNKSGIAKAIVKWRKKGTTAWNELQMELVDGVFASAIPGNMDANEETIEYYLEARSKNEKVMVNPIVAPEGFYSFTYGKTVGVADENIYGAALDEPFPNPTHGEVIVPMSLQKDCAVTFDIVDITGNRVQSVQLGNQHAGSFMYRVNVENLSAGVYTIRMVTNGIPVSVKKIVLY